VNTKELPQSAAIGFGVVAPPPLMVKICPFAIIKKTSAVCDFVSLVLFTFLFSHIYLLFL